MGKISKSVVKKKSNVTRKGVSKIMKKKASKSSPKIAKRTTAKRSAARSSVRSSARSLKAPCSAIKEMKDWMVKSGFNKSKLSRRLDLSWETLRKIQSGESRPNVDVVLLLNDMAKIPMDSWRLSQ